MTNFRTEVLASLSWHELVAKYTADVKDKSIEIRRLERIVVIRIEAQDYFVQGCGILRLSLLAKSVCVKEVSGRVLVCCR